MDGSTSYHGNDRAIKTPSLNIFSTREEKDPNTSPFVGLMPADTHSSLPTTAAPRRRWHWNSVSFILGFQLVAFLSALAHYLLFEHLHGSPVDSSRLTQSHVSAISLLFVTLFKSALTASVGSCFAQHLWHILRCGATSVSLIEKLFVLRTNALALCDPRAIRRAPLLFLMAAYVWCLGIATIYPPGAITVGSRPHTSTQPMEVLTIDSNGSANFDQKTYARKEPFDTLASLTWRVKENGFGRNGGDAIYFDYGGARPALANIAQSIMMGDRMLSSPSYTGENTTYRLKLRAPQFQCNTTTSREERDLTEEDSQMHTLAFNSTWNRYHSILTIEKHVVNHVYSLTSKENPDRFGAIDVQRLSCKGQSTSFDLNVTHTKGTQSLNYAVSDVEPLGYLQGEFSTGVGMPPRPYTNTTLYEKLSEGFTRKVASYMPLMNDVALLDSLSRMVSSTANQSCNTQDASFTCTEDRKLANGSIIMHCNCPWDGLNDDSFKLKGSALHTNRFNSSLESDGTGDSNPWSTTRFNPSTDINPTEDLLNTLIYNITLSALSLGIWKEKVPVMATTYRNTYQFSHKKNLVLPYSICLGVAIVFAIIALWSLHQNGIPVADGGFLQVMMATRGDTQMERLVLKDGITAVDDMSKELGSLKVRYGELVSQEKRMGFGTTDETLALRKRK